MKESSEKEKEDNMLTLVTPNVEELLLI